MNCFLCVSRKGRKNVWPRLGSACRRRRVCGGAGRPEAQVSTSPGLVRRAYLHLYCYCLSFCGFAVLTSWVVADLWGPGPDPGDLPFPSAPRDAHHATRIHSNKSPSFFYASQQYWTPILVPWETFACNEGAILFHTSPELYLRLP